MEENTAPYTCHILVCTNDREGKRKSCADSDSPGIRKSLKAGVKERGWVGDVRVSQCGCLGLCQKGPNVIIYPQNEWFASVSPADTDAILSKVESFLG